MHRIRSGILGLAVAVLLAVGLAGCGDSSEDGGTVGFKPTDTKPLEPMVKEMQDMMKKQTYNKPPVVPSEKPKGTEKKK